MGDSVQELNREHQILIVEGGTVLNEKTKYF